ncbi:VOC family protein [Kineosporia sp. NBRC 101731]|uniref:bleomycin resistance protein n=1 Tax=Kineosporia sp. NBRC 101731 TaxID=3032199 RepID=UPI0024A0AB54|nr:VOC family protein [Kineosporia sp. NBRC 101731]GLY33394.1 hypothetical protein Kisp02_67590 [Kineosporia sp. NBRC 101731]
MPGDRLAELGDTPGVHICAGCALWAARRASRLPDLHRLTHAVGHLARWRPGRQRGAGTVNSTIPILPSADLDRTIAFWQHLGFDVADRYDGYLVTHAGGVEIHFSRNHDAPAEGGPAQVFIHVHNAAALFARLTGEHVAGLEPLQDQDYGLREFVITDPDGNRIRIGSPLD